MKAVLVNSPGNFGLTQLPDPTPAPDQIIVAPDGCGICGTDIHILEGDIALTEYPIVPGHEFSGEVVALGKDVTHLKVGDVVAVEPSLFCGYCHFCRQGRENLCQNFNSLGVVRENGGCAELVAVPQRKAFVLPEGFPRQWGALVEPVSCAVHGFDMIASRVADHVLIYGAGTMGLMLCQLAAHHGFASVSVVDTNADRLPRAAALGADFIATSAAELDRPQGWEVVIDATGAIPAIEDALARVRTGGTVLLFGVASMDAAARFSPYRVMIEEIRIVGSMAILHSFERAIEVIGRGWIDGDSLITHRVALKDYAQAIDLFRAGDGLKILVDPKA